LEAGCEEAQGCEVRVELVDAGGKLDDGGALVGEEGGDCGVCWGCVRGSGEEAMEVLHLLHEGVLEDARRVGVMELGAVGLPEGAHRVVCGVFAARCWGWCAHSGCV
jgi:hypothetical protein